MTKKGIEQAIGFQLEPKTVSYAESDLALYALSIGAAADPLDPSELPFVYELFGKGFQAFPTYAVTFPFTLMWQIGSAPGLDFNPALLLHGEQYLEIKQPLPTSGTVTNKAHIADIYDKGSGALVLLDVHTFDEEERELAYNQLSLFIRGIGGFGGERGPSGKINLPPERPPDAIHRQQTQENQALFYRLSSGDRNPLHADPAFAAAGGFERPILHGLCTLGFATRAVLKEFAGNDPVRFKSVKTRFTQHVYPGETIITEIWKESATRIIFQCKVAEREGVALSNAAVELNE